MEEEQGRINIKKVILVAILIIIIVLGITNAKKVFGSKSEVYVVANGSLYYEESSEGYVIRDETILEGQNSKNGMVQVLLDGERAAKNERVFRYYSNSEDSILAQISDLDVQINEIMESSGQTIVSSDIASLEKQIESTVSSMYDLNDLQKINENKTKIDTYIFKKAQLSAMLSPEDSYVKQLTEQRNNLEKQLEEGSESIYAPQSGLLSYRIDGLENILKTDNFDYLTIDLLKGFNLKVGAVVPQSTEKGKIVNNFECYIATIMNTENAMNANVGDKVKIRLSNYDELDSEITAIKEEGKERIIVFKIDRDIDSLLEYRKISIDVVWWSYNGWKISNACIINENDQTFVERKKANYNEKIPIKVLRQNDTYSIVENYTDDELRELGFSESDIDSLNSIKLYDEILLH